MRFIFILCILPIISLSVRKELHILRDMLMHKYGRDFSIGVMENRDKCVSERVRTKISFILDLAFLKKESRHLISYSIQI